MGAALEPVLPAWTVAGNDLWLVCPSRKLNSPALESYIDFALRCDAINDYYPPK